MRDAWILYGSELSPFTLKVRAMLDFRQVPYRFLFDQGNTFDNLKVALRKEALVRGLLPLTWPVMTEDDEYPLLPFLFGAKGENLYDSTAIGQWLDINACGSNLDPLTRFDDPAVEFAIALIDEYADEFGLYIVHHNRWKLSAQDNNAGARLAGELRSVVGPLGRVIDRVFSARQVRRLPYLFSVAPRDYRVSGLPNRLQPPAHRDFPPTHALLEDSFARLLAACEALLAVQPFLLGDRFTLADASLHGELGMNLKDPSAQQWIARSAPHTHAWLLRIAAGDFAASHSNGTLSLHAGHRPLLAEICRTYVPLMQQNLAAYQQCRTRGETLFNEAAFRKNVATYAGTLDGIPFKHVVKSFQVTTWRKIRAQWDALSPAGRSELEAVLPAGHGLNLDVHPTPVPEDDPVAIRPSA